MSKPPVLILDVDENVFSDRAHTVPCIIVGHFPEGYFLAMNYGLSCGYTTIPLYGVFATREEAVQRRSELVWAYDPFEDS